MRRILMFILISALIAGCDTPAAKVLGIRNDTGCADWHPGAYEIWNGGFLDSITGKTYYECCYAHWSNETVRQLDKVIENPLMTYCTYIEEK